MCVIAFCVQQIKSVLIQLYAKKGDAVLDLACGKVVCEGVSYMICNWFVLCELMWSFRLCFYQGGDLIKWDKARIGYYVGIDIADGSVSIDPLNSQCSCNAELCLSSLVLRWRS